jgi:dTMP kinase
MSGSSPAQQYYAEAAGWFGPRYNRAVHGVFITFEGVEGSGKSTQVALLVRFLAARGADVVTTREPGGTRLGERVRDILLDPASDPVAISELFLLEAARAQLVSSVVAPALAQGRFVVSDRFADSSAAYQGTARALGTEVVATLNRIACGEVVPTRTVVLDLAVEIALSRARSRPTTTTENSRFEDEASAFHRQVAAGYRRLAEREPSRVRLVDASGSPHQVHERVLAELQDLLP